MPITIQDIRREIRRAIAPFLPLLPPGSGPGSGDVVGPSSSIENAIAVFADATGKVIDDRPVRIYTVGTTVRLTSSATGFQDFEILGTSGAFLGPGYDISLIGGQGSVAPDHKGGDVYIDGGVGEPHGRVYISNAVLDVADGTFQEVSAGSIVGLNTDDPAPFPSGIEVDDIWEYTSGHGIHLQDPVTVEYMIHEVDISLLALATAYSF